MKQHVLISFLVVSLPFFVVSCRKKAEKRAFVEEHFLNMKEVNVYYITSNALDKKNRIILSVWKKLPKSKGSPIVSGRIGIEESRALITFQRMEVYKDFKINLSGKISLSDGEVRINKEVFDISKGNIFLLQVRGKETEIEQLEENCDEFPPGKEGLIEISKINTRIKTFVYDKNSSTIHIEDK